MNKKGKLHLPILTLSLSLLIFSAYPAFSQVTVSNLKTENRANPLGIDVRAVRLSWQLSSAERGVLQTAYSIRVSTDAAELEKKGSLVWNSGKINSDSSNQVLYKGPALVSGTRYYWQVKVWDQKGHASAWSTVSFWQTALLNKEEWTARWISPGFQEDTPSRPCPVFRKRFSIHKKIRSAYAYITAHGLYEAQLNGQRVGDAYLTPGWTSYAKRLQYQTYDLSSELKQGENVIGLTVGNGWYSGYLVWAGRHNLYGKDASILFQLAITYEDGSKEEIKSDNTWKSSIAEIRNSEIYNGETIDARLEKKGWSAPGYDDKDWSGVKSEDFSFDNLVASSSEPVRKHERVKPVKLTSRPDGSVILDFGQNLVGWVQVRASGKAGDKIVISHAEVLQKSGDLYTENLRAAKEQNTYILKGNGQEVFEPHFSWQGFRYIHVEGYPGTLKAEDFTAVVLYSDMEKTGNFKTSNALINQLQHNIEWGQRGNFLDVPTDCPQRDERLGWTGDAQVFSRTASFLRNVEPFFGKWMKDVAADQRPNGGIPFVIPTVPGVGGEGATGWADVSTIIPWNMYLAYGDKRILEQQYPSMKKWVQYMVDHSKNDLWNTGDHFGDWLFFSKNNDVDGSSAITSKYLIAQCFFAYSTQLLMQTAQVLGKPEDVNYYSTLLERVKKAFLNEYVTPNGGLTSDSQTAYVLALQFDMLPESLRAQAADRLVDNIKRYDTHLTTGFLGTPYLCHVLSRFGKLDMAYKLLLQDTYPSWLYPVKMGATTIWERWDGIRPDGSFETPTMNSYNHYAYGAIGDWMYRVAAGLDTYEDGTGYHHIKIYPHPGGGFTSMSASLETPYGKLSSEWKTGKSFSMHVQIPGNTRAEVFVPAASVEQIMEGGKKISDKKEIKLLGKEADYVKVEVGSGDYNFSVN